MVWYSVGSVSQEEGRVVSVAVVVLVLAADAAFVFFD